MSVRLFLVLLFSLATTLRAWAQTGPEISVRYTSGNEITPGATYNFGRTTTYLFYLLTLKVHNTGDQPLTGVLPTLTGPQASEFGTTPLSAVTVQPGGEATLTVGLRTTLTGPLQATLSIASNDADENPKILNLAATGVPAKFTVLGPDGQEAPQGTVYDFGNIVSAQGFVSRTLTLKNIGEGAIWVPTADVTDSATVEFVAYPATGTFIAAGGSIACPVIFDPNQLGERTATLNIRNFQPTTPFGSGKTGLYKLYLKGTGTLPSYNFSAATYQTVHGLSSTLVTVTRDLATTASSVTLTMVDAAPTASPPFETAQPGVDYPATPGLVVSFAAGELQKTVAVPLISPSARAGVNRHLQLVLTSPTDGHSIGTQGIALLRVLATDTTKPTLTLTTPLAGDVKGLPPQRITGTVGDAKGIDRVTLALNDSESLPVQLGTATSPTSIPFDFDLDVIPGPNVLVITAYDLRGNSTTLTRRFTFSFRWKLTVEIRDDNTGELADMGSVPLSAVPAASASALVSTDAGKTTSTSSVAENTALKFIATPKKGMVFSSWDIVFPDNGYWPVDAAWVGNQLSMKMATTDVTLRAFFTPTPFTAPAGTSTQVHALVTQTQTGLEWPGERQAYLTGTLTSTGSFSGKLFIAGKTLPFTCTLFGAGDAMFTVGGKKTIMMDLPVWGAAFGMTTTGDPAEPFELYMIFDYDPPNDRHSSGRARRVGYSITNKVPAGMLTNATSGSYTLYMDKPAYRWQLGMDEFTPDGHGYASMALTNTGTVTFAGLLADGTSLTMSSALLSTNEIPFFVQLTTPGATTKNGLVTGMMNLEPQPLDTYLRAGLLWYRPVAASANVLLYSQGWPTGLYMDAYGARYFSTQAAQFALGLGQPQPSVGNAQLTFTGGGLTQSVVKTNFSVVNNSVIKLPKTDTSYTLTLAPGTGLFSGSFTPVWPSPATTKPVFKGIILQGVGGYGFFLNNTKAPPTDGSGSLTLGPPTLGG